MSDYYEKVIEEFTGEWEKRTVGNGMFTAGDMLEAHGSCMGFVMAASISSAGGDRKKMMQVTIDMLNECIDVNLAMLEKPRDPKGVN